MTRVEVSGQFMDDDSDLAPQVPRDEESPTVGTKADHHTTKVDVQPNQKDWLTAVTSESEDVESHTEHDEQQSSSEVHESTKKARKEPDIEKITEGVIYKIYPRLTGKRLKIKRAQPSAGCCGSLLSVTDKYAVDGLGTEEISWARKKEKKGKTSPHSVTTVNHNHYFRYGHFPSSWVIRPWPKEMSGGDDGVVKISSIACAQYYLAIRNSQLCLSKYRYKKKNSKPQPEGALFYMRKVEETSADDQIITLESVSEPGNFVTFNKEGEPCHPQTQNELARQMKAKFLMSYGFYWRMRH